MKTNPRVRQKIARAKKDGRVLASDLKDSISEIKHRVGAAGERAKRHVAGDAMTTREKAGSVVKEAGHRGAAAIDKTKRQLRDRLNRPK